MSDPRAFVLADALKSLGINPDNDPVYHAKRWIEGRDSDRRERDQAITERDNAAARVAARDMRITDLERDLAALKRICEVIGAPVPCVAEDAVEAVTTLLCTNEGHNLRADRAEETLAEIATVLDRYDIPTHYDDASHPCADGQPITLVDRVHLGMTILNDGLIGAVARLRNAEQFLACRDDELRDANDALDAIGAPRGAGKRDRLLDVASRIRASLSR